MTFLLDTHTFLWYYTGSTELSQNAKIILDKQENDFFVSIASIWEITIKHSLGKLDLDAPLDVFFQDVIAKNFNILQIDVSHLLRLATLPFHHRDPFDRLLIGQSMAENMPIITKDTLFQSYCSTSGLETIW